jgi:hypothetical protein
MVSHNKPSFFSIVIALIYILSENTVVIDYLLYFLQL